MWNDKELEFFDSNGVERPSQDPHGTDSFENPISNKLDSVKCTNWRMNGNRLICDTPLGPLVQLMPINVIMTGVDDNGRPILKNIYKS